MLQATKKVGPINIYLNLLDSVFKMFLHEQM